MAARKYALAAAMLLVAGCATSSNQAPPPVSSAVISSARMQGISTGALLAGRQTFVTRCTACHALPSIDARTAAEWPKAVGEMAGRANLSSQQREELTAYLVMARNSG